MYDQINGTAKSDFKAQSQKVPVSTSGWVSKMQRNKEKNSGMVRTSLYGNRVR